LESVLTSTFVVAIVIGECKLKMIGTRFQAQKLNSLMLFVFLRFNKYFVYYLVLLFTSSSIF